MTLRSGLLLREVKRITTHQLRLLRQNGSMLILSRSCIRNGQVYGVFSVCSVLTISSVALTTLWSRMVLVEILYLMHSLPR
jgi:hypothetical protein